MTTKSSICDPILQAAPKELFYPVIPQYVCGDLFCVVEHTLRAT